jgi:ubiquinone biosynthesis protein Coq4
VLVQYRNMLNVFVLSHAPWFAIGNWQQIPELIKAMKRGFAMGWKCQPVVAYPFEANWEKPLLEVRRELGIGSGEWEVD